VAATPTVVDLSPLGALTSLSCLALHGIFAHPLDLDLSGLPSSLKDLSISLYHLPDMVAGESNLVEFDLMVLESLPKDVKLETLSVKALELTGNWAIVCTRAAEVRLAAETMCLFLGTTVRTLPPCQHDASFSITPPQQHAEVSIHECLACWYDAAAAAVAAAPRLVVVQIACEALLLSVGDRRPRLSGDAISPGIELEGQSLDDFLGTMRTRLLESWNVIPAYEGYKDFVNDESAASKVYILSLERQGPLPEAVAAEQTEAGEALPPRSFYLYSPATNEELQLLRRQPAWHLVWNADPRAPAMLRDPEFIETQAGSLVSLVNVPLGRWDGLVWAALVALTDRLPPCRQAARRAASELADTVGANHGASPCGQPHL
jgi:hypothetical protein